MIADAQVIASSVLGTSTDPLAATDQAASSWSAAGDQGRRAVGEEGVGDRPFRARPEGEVEAAQFRRAERHAAPGSLTASARATRKPFKAPWQPMKPTWVRWTEAFNPRSRINFRSTPGAAKPVQETVTRCVMSLR